MLLGICPNTCPGKRELEIKMAQGYLQCQYNASIRGRYLEIHPSLYQKPHAENNKGILIDIDIVN